MASLDERRIDQTAKIAVLEEKSFTIQKQLDQITANFQVHARAEEQNLDEIYSAVVQLNNHIDEKIEKVISPMKDEIAASKTAITKYKTILNFIIWVLGGLGTFAVIFKDFIVAWLIHK